MRKILLTSFQPWLKHQRSNASDDLLALISQNTFPGLELCFLRNLPVDTELASNQTILAIAEQQPNVVICCGMAESYDCLTVESQAQYQGQQYCTPLNLPALTVKLQRTLISDDAGKFVCEGLYFQVLQYLAQHPSTIPAVFVHVPVLTPANQGSIHQDFVSIIENLGQNLEAYLV